MWNLKLCTGTGLCFIQSKKWHDFVLTRLPSSPISTNHGHLKGFETEPSLSESLSQASTNGRVYQMAENNSLRTGYTRVFHNMSEGSGLRKNCKKCNQRNTFEDLISVCRATGNQVHYQSSPEWLSERNISRQLSIWGAMSNKKKENI